MPALKRSMDSPSIAPWLGNVMKSSYEAAGVGKKVVKSGDEVAQGTKNVIQNTTTKQYSQKIKWGIQEIDVRPEGKGFWGKRILPSNPRVDAYEIKINPNNESYYLKHPRGGFVQYENMINDVVQDGKLIMQQKSLYHVNDLPDFAKNKVLQEAIRQVDAANAVNYKVEWLISDSKAVKQLAEFFKNNNINIDVKYFQE